VASPRELRRFLEQSFRQDPARGRPQQPAGT
jgi:hypothetical protein